MLSRISSNAVLRAALRPAKLAYIEARRAFVQPSGADRASVVDVPQAYQEDGVFTPRAGSRRSLSFRISVAHLHRNADMLGFKLEMPQREDSLTGKARPIYLDMQVSTVHLRCPFSLLTPSNRRLPHLIPVSLTPCFPI